MTTSPGRSDSPRSFGTDSDSTSPGGSIAYWPRQQRRHSDPLPCAAHRLQIEEHRRPHELEDVDIFGGRWVSKPSERRTSSPPDLLRSCSLGCRARSVSSVLPFIREASPLVTPPPPVQTSP